MSAEAQEQQTVLQRFLAACKEDERVVAAFLGGSLAAGRADEWSDLDLYLITTEEAYEDFAAGVRDFIGRLGHPIFLESFDLTNTLFFMLADGTECELSFAPENRFLDIHSGPYKVLLDKKGALADAVFLGHQPARDDQVEILRRQIYWFWHDLSHFVTALGRGQLWWAQGQLETLRRICLNLARLQYNFADAEVGEEPHFKIENAIPVGEIEPLRASVGPMEPGALFQSVLVVVDFYKEKAQALAEKYDLSYPLDLERVVLSRLERVRRTIQWIE